MICLRCRVERHTDCPGGTWCDCQHRTDRQPAPATDPTPYAPSDEQLSTIAAATGVPFGDLAARIADVKRTASEGTP